MAYPVPVPGGLMSLAADSVNEKASEVSQRSPAVAPLSNAVANETATYILVVGEVKVGKSSFINALTGGFVSNAARFRETFQPIWLQFDGNGKEENIKAISEKLEAAHLANEHSRENIKELKEEQISTMMKVTDDDLSLPLRYGLKKHVLIDCPGINDAQDDKKMFVNSVKTQIPMADLIIYLVDAADLFQKKSAKTEFESIQAEVAKKRAGGQFIDLIVVVNKFDAVDDSDLNKVYANLPNILGIKEDHIYRFSSHKMLIYNVYSNKLNLYVPPFLQKAFLQDVAQVCNTKKAGKTLKQHSIVQHNELEFNEVYDFEADEEPQAASEGNGAEGAQREGAAGETDDPSYEEKQNQQRAKQSLNSDEYLKVISFIKKFQTELPQKRVDALKDKLKTEWTDCEAAIKKAIDELESLQAYYIDQRVPQITLALHTRMESIFKLHARLKYAGAEIIFFAVVYDFNAMFSIAKHVKSKSPLKSDVFHDFLKVMFHFALLHSTVMTQQMIDLGSTQFDWMLQSWYFQSHCINDIREFPEHDLHLSLQRQEAVRFLKVLLSDQRSFEATEMEYFNTPKLSQDNRNCAKIERGKLVSLMGRRKPIRLKAEYATLHRSPLVFNAINSPHTPAEIRVMILLSITPLATLEVMDRAQELPYSLLERFGADLIHKLRFAITERENDSEAIQQVLKDGALECYLFKMESLPGVEKFMRDRNDLRKGLELMKEVNEN